MVTAPTYSVTKHTKDLECDATRQKDTQIYRRLYKNAKDLKVENKREGIFTNAERGWVVPPSDSPRHTGDM